MASEPTSSKAAESEGPLEPFEVILEEDSDSEAEGNQCEIEMTDFKDTESDMETLYFSDDSEDGRESPTILSLYTQYGEKILIGQSQASTRASSSLDIECDDDNFGSDVMEENHVFHQAYEHPLLEQEGVSDVVPERPQQQRRGGAAGRGARGQRNGDPQIIGDRLERVYVNDDDLPDVLKDGILRIEKAREAARVRVMNRTKRGRQEDETGSYFAVEGTSNRFKWSPVMADFKGEREQFLPQRTGAVVSCKNPYEAFMQYWDESTLAHIVTETNRYAAELAGSCKSFSRDWYDTNVHEILVLFSFWMMLGIIRLPSIKSCFTLNPLLQTNIFRKMFSRNRYVALCRAFHLADNSSRPTKQTDVLFPLGPIADRLNARFQQVYIPSQNICIDESLTLWKGNLSFRQYSKTKAAQYGVKTFELCESDTGYLWSFFIYRGAGTSFDSNLPSSTSKSTSTVLNLMKPLLDKGYTLFMDYWFNSPLLARFLKARKTDCVGTLCAKCTNVPSLISLCNLKEGQFVSRHSGDVMVLAFQDRKRKVALISTYHGDSQGLMEVKPYRPTKYRLQAVLDYNKYMGGVDRKDSMLEPYLLERKRGKKWNVKFFKHLLNCSILNARILLQSSTATQKEHIAFRLELVDQILQLHLQHVPKYHQAQPVVSSLSFPEPAVHHFPEQSERVTALNNRSRLRCVYCSKNKIAKRTTIICCGCKAPLCITPCFKLYHTQK